MNIKGFGNITWMTNLPVQHRKLVLKEEYDPVKYPKYDNYEAIEVGRVEDIPMDYDGVMGVPLTIIQYDLDNIELLQIGGDYLPKELFEEFLSQGYKTHYGKKLLIYRKDGRLVMPYNRVMIKIVGLGVGNSAANDFGVEAGYTRDKKDRGGCPLIDGKIKYGRVFIKRNDTDRC